MELLEVHGVSKRYRDFQLEDIDFVLPKGYIMGYVGRNGAGKSTTLNLIMNLCKCTAGSIRVDGFSCEEDEARYKEQIGYIGDEFYYSLYFTVKNIREILQNFYPTFDRDRFDELIAQWQLPEKTKFKDFSRGMRVKLMFASVLARETKLLILDEATNGLDPVVRAEVLRLLQDYIADGEHSVLFSTHILSDLEQIADYIFFIDEGKKVLFGAKDELLENYVLVKGERRDVTPALAEEMIGIIDQAYGFEALMESGRAALLARDFLCEKPTIDAIVLHYIQDKTQSGKERAV